RLTCKAGAGKARQLRCRDIPVIRLTELVPRRQVDPQLEAMQAMTVLGGHLRVYDTAPGRHPLGAPAANLAAIAMTVLVDNAAMLHVGERLHAPVGVGWKAAGKILATLGLQLVEHEKGIQPRVAHAGDAADGHAIAIATGP